MTFVETRDNGRYVRAIVQAEESTAGPNPFTLAVYEGSVTKTGGQNVLTLKKKRNGTVGLQAPRDWGILFSSYEVTLTLRLAKKGELQGVASYYGGREEVELQKAGRLQPFADPLQIAREVTTPGTVWEGTLQHKTEAAEQMTLIFTEVRDEGKYVRAVAVPKNDPFNLVILEGTVLSDDVRRHAFAIQLRKKTSGWSRSNTLFSLNTETLFSLNTEDDVKILLHCSFNGQKLYGLAGHYSGTDRLILTRMNPQPKFVALDTKSFSQTIRQACAPGKKWVGELQNLKLKSGAKIEVRFGQQNMAGTTVQVLFRLPRVRGADVLFAGTFRLDDVNVNGYCLELKKVGGGVKDSKTTLFNDDTDWTVYLGLALRGQRLYGYATHRYRGLVEKFVLSPAGTDTLKKKTSRR